MKKLVTSFLLVTMLAMLSGGMLFFTYLSFEPGILQAASTSTVQVNLQVVAEASVSCSTTTVSMTPTIAGMTGGQANASTTCTVITTNSTGFSMTLQSTSTPSMKCMSGGCNVDTDDFNDYTPAGANPDKTWSVDAAAAEFGYNVKTEANDDAATLFKNDGADNCGFMGGTNTNLSCWLNASTTPVTIVNRASATDGLGEDEVINFRAEAGASAVQPSGNYQATVIVTVTAN